MGHALCLEAKDLRDATVGFGTLLLATAGHEVLEAARDGLFLQSLPVTRLPWAYLAIALLTFAGSSLGGHLFARVSRQRALSLTLLTGAVMTSAFSILPLARDSSLVLMGLYVWAGVFMTAVVVQFWLLAGEIMDFGQAKRAYAVLGAGALLGAVMGSMIASAALLVTAPRSLPVLAALLFLVAAFVPRHFSGARTELASREPPLELSARTARELVRDAYLQRVLGLVLIGTVAVTFSDYAFKSVVVRDVAPARLPEFFARYYGVVNALALVVELVVVPKLIRVRGMHRLVLVMPLLMLAASVGFVASATLLSVLLLKGVDGSLRHSMNRIGTESLYLPLRQKLRERVRVFMEAVGLRGGQALASLLVLGATALGLGERAFAYLVLGLSATWTLVAFGIERPYFRTFRVELTKPRLRVAETAPQFDLSSLEVLLKALSSTKDREVVTALETFDAWRKTDLIPASILYHPSDAVVLHALQIFSQANRRGVEATVFALLGKTTGCVAAAALRFCIRHAPDRALFCRERSNADSGVRATALIGLIRMGELEEREAVEAIQMIATDGDKPAQCALGEGLALLPAQRWCWVLDQLASGADKRAAMLAAKSLASEPHAAFLPALIRLLEPRETRSEARAALVPIGVEALEALNRKLIDPLTPLALRRHLPRTISRFAGPRAVEVLELALGTERDDVVAFKILRGLCRMRRDDPGLPANHALLRRAQWRALGRAATLTCWQYVLDRAAAEGAVADAQGLRLLARVLAGHTERAMERIFRILHVLEPTASVVDVFQAVASHDPDLRARGIELIEHLMPGAFGRALVGFLTDSPLHARLANFSATRLGRECAEALLLARASGAALPEVGRADMASPVRACLCAIGEDSDSVLRLLARHCFSNLPAPSDEVAHAG